MESWVSVGTLLTTVYLLSLYLLWLLRKNYASAGIRALVNSCSRMCTTTRLTTAVLYLVPTVALLSTTARDAGTLVQRTMADPLYCRYHYGHPDMLDKLALLAQGGVSKATKDLNLSEDVFAGMGGSLPYLLWPPFLWQRCLPRLRTGMDATLRGQTVVHREYFQVGKGRDLGAITILQFFSKLSQGTAQMTTSRQVYAYYGSTYYDHLPPVLCLPWLTLLTL